MFRTNCLFGDLERALAVLCVLTQHRKLLFFELNIYQFFENYFLMKSLFYTIEKSSRLFSKSGFAGLLFVMAFATTLTAQKGDDHPAGISTSTGAVQVDGTPWKSTFDYSGVLTAERDVAASQIIAPGAALAHVALYTGYDRLLAYMQADVAAQLPKDGIVANSFQKVVAEMPNDPILVNMDIAKLAELRTILTGELLQ